MSHVARGLRLGRGRERRIIKTQRGRGRAAQRLTLSCLPAPATGREYASDMSEAEG